MLPTSPQRAAAEPKVAKRRCLDKRKEDRPSRDVNNLSRNSSVIARNSGGFGESIYQYRGWKQSRRTEKRTSKRTSSIIVDMKCVKQKPFWAGGSNFTTFVDATSD